jgi:hypothetical protein
VPIPCRRRLGTSARDASAATGPGALWIRFLRGHGDPRHMEHAPAGLGLGLPRTAR